MNSDQLGYELIDFGDGRKLERFGPITVDRPARGASMPKSLPDAWESAELIYTGDRMNSSAGRWSIPAHSSGSLGELLEGWECVYRDLTLKIAPQKTGQLGVFPEHWNHWDWLRSRIADGLALGPVRVLHLFAYTGATTLWMALQGATVTHVDAMKHAVNWARINASLSGLESKPIRWIVEDARKYVARELRRNSSYDLVVLDPPSYGHGCKGEAWEIHRDLVPLMRDCWKLLSDGAIGVLLTSHSLNISAKELRMEMHVDALRQPHESQGQAKSGGASGSRPQIETEISPSFLQDCSARRLECGEAIRFQRQIEKNI